MRFEAGRTREQVLDELRSAAEQTWGAQRAEALAPALEQAAGALWRLSQAPLAFLDDEPDWVAGGRRGGEG